MRVDRLVHRMESCCRSAVRISLYMQAHSQGDGGGGGGNLRGSPQRMDGEGGISSDSAAAAAANLCVSSSEQVGCSRAASNVRHVVVTTYGALRSWWSVVSSSTGGPGVRPNLTLTTSGSRFSFSATCSQAGSSRGHNWPPRTAKRTTPCRAACAVRPARRAVAGDRV